jgi:hypothetical protein
MEDTRIRPVVFRPCLATGSAFHDKALSSTSIRAFGGDTSFRFIYVPTQETGKEPYTFTG